MMHGAYNVKRPTYFGHSCGHLQGDDTKNKKLNDDTIIEVTGSVRDIK